VHQSSLKPTAFTKLYSSSPVKLIPRSTRMLKRKETLQFFCFCEMLPLTFGGRAGKMPALP